MANEVSKIIDKDGVSHDIVPSAHSHAISDVTGLQTALDAKQPTLVSGTNIKTVNNQSLVGSGNITAGGGQYPIVTVPASGATIEMDSNKFYMVTGAATTLDLTLNTPADNTIVNEYCISFVVGANLEFTCSPAITAWQGGSPTWLAGARYEIYIINGYATVNEFVTT